MIDMKMIIDHNDAKDGDGAGREVICRKAPPVRNILLSMLSFEMRNRQFFLKFKREFSRTRISVSLWDGDVAGRKGGHFQEGYSDTEWEGASNLLVLPPPTSPPSE